MKILQTTSTVKTKKLPFSLGMKLYYLVILWLIMISHTVRWYQKFQQKYNINTLQWI